MAVLQTKYVNVGSIGTFVYGYYYTSSYSYGVLSDTSGGSQNSSLSSVVSGAVCELCNYGSSGNGFVQMTIKGSSSAPSATVFDTLKIAGTSFARSAASSSVSGTVRTWLWSPISSNPFGNILGANKLVTWETTTSTPTYTLTAPTSINEGSLGTFNIATTNVSTGTSLYWSVTSSSQFTGSTTGTVTTNSSGAASFSVTPTADSTTEGALTVTARIRTGSQGGTIVDSDTFVVNDTSTTPAADTTPNAFNLNDVGPVAAGTVATSTAVQITGMDANTPCSISGQGSPQLRVGGGNGTWTTSSTISPNFYINARLTAPTAYSSTHTATLTIGTVTDTITVTSAAAPSGAGGTGTTGGTGSYGIKIFDTNGTTSVLSPSTRYMVRLTDPTSISLAATSGSSTLISCTMTGLSTSNSDLIFEQFATVDDVPVTRESNGFRITNNSGAVFNNIVYVVRF